MKVPPNRTWYNSHTQPLSWQQRPTAANGVFPLSKITRRVKTDKESTQENPQLATTEWPRFHLVFVIPPNVNYTAKETVCYEREMTDYETTSVPSSFAVG